MPTTEEAETMTFEAACEILGVTEDHTTMAVRDAFRLIEMRSIRQVERTNADPDEVHKATLSFQRARRAREVLLEEHFNRFAEPGDDIDHIVPEPETHQIGELTVTVTYEWAYYGPLIGAISIAEGDVASLTALPDPIYSAVHKIEVTGNPEGTRYYHVNGSFEEFRNEYQAEQRQANRQSRFNSLSERLEAADRTLSVMLNQGYPINRLRQLLHAAREYVLSSRFSNRHGTFVDAERRVKAVEAEIERINTNRLEVLVDELMEGHVFRTLADYNRIEIDKINNWSIRTGGFVDYWSDQRLRDFYVERCTKHYISTRDDVRRLQYEHLRLNADEIASDELMVELCELGEFEVAPRTIELKSRKGNVEYALSFQVNEGVPEALLTIPLSTYEKNRPEHGKRSSFPDLPHGIRYRLIITQAERELARGLLTEIDSRLTKIARGQQRGKNVPKTDEFGLRRRAPIESTQPPPWAVGVRAR